MMPSSRCAWARFKRHSTRSKRSRCACPTSPSASPRRPTSATRRPLARPQQLPIYTRICGQYATYVVLAGCASHGASDRRCRGRTRWQPPNALLDVHAALSAIFPQCAKRMDDSGEVSDEPFSPHLTVGQCTREEAAEISRNWTGGSMIVSAIHVLSRSDINATFKIRHTFYLREREPRE